MKKSHFDHKTVEKKWQKKWIEEKVYEPDIKSSQKPFYNLMMFPYPSAEGLHVGNVYAFTGADVFGRFKRMQGYDVLQPIGLDGFGIHSENYAIKVGRHPKEHASISEKHFYDQLSSIGNGFSWSRKLETYDPVYYRWTQWLFIQMFKKGLAYKGIAMVNWCPSCKTVLADEQVEDGKCERCKSEVTRREMSSWYFRITKYADKLLENIETIDWPAKIKIAQKNWIGKKEGAIVQFGINFSSEPKTEAIPVFTTRLETLFGVTFLVVAPEIAKSWIDKYGWQAPESVSKYINESLNKSEQDRGSSKEKTGEDTGLFATNPANEVKVPIYVADYVLSNFGTGAVMGVPAHDQRDFEFAQKYKLPIVAVIKPESNEHEIDNGKLYKKGGTGEKIETCFEGEGVLVNSSKYNNMDTNSAKNAMFEDYVDFAKKETTYHLRDWLISRQRYWGPPIPMIYCQSCASLGKGERADLPGWYCVDDNQLPILLPDIEDFKPKGDGTSPLANANDDWKNIKCPNCGANAIRELDVSDTFLDSSWYFLAYPHLTNGIWKEDSNPFDGDLINKWLPVNTYIGGAEHAVLHLLYARFVTMVLKDLGYVNFEEPFPFLYGHGLIIKDGSKMSKSRGNVVVPDEYIEKYGSDTLRTYLMFLGPYDSGGDFRDTGIEGMRRFVDRVWTLFSHSDISLNKVDSEKLQYVLNKTIKKVGEDTSLFRYNTAISSIMELTNMMRDLAKNSTGTNASSDVWANATKSLALMIAPFAPHLAEEVWCNLLGQEFSVHKSTWPTYDPIFLESSELTVVVQVNGKVRATLRMKTDDANNKQKVVRTAYENKNLDKWFEQKEVVNEIFVPGKVINFVTK